MMRVLVTLVGIAIGNDLNHAGEQRWFSLT